MFLHSFNTSHFVRAGLAGLALIGTGLLGACGDSDNDDWPEGVPTSALMAGDEEADAEAHPTPDPNATPTPDPGPPDVTVKVELDEWSVKSSAKTVKPGVVRFVADNIGDETHELVILKDSDELVEIEGLASKHVEGVTIELEKGKYVLACLIVEVKPDGTIVNHYGKGMKTNFEVK